MEHGKRVRIADIAEELGVSTATVSNVIHGKTKKISKETVKRVQKLLEEKEYIPSMAGILLAQNNSRIIGVIINGHPKYEGHVIEDPFIASAVNHLAYETDKYGYFMMVKITSNTADIVKFASMWNLSGMVLIGFCSEDYVNLRNSVRIPFVIYDGYFESEERLCNIVIDNENGGYQVGRHLAALGHKKLLCISDNGICMDLERYQGFCRAAEENGAKADFMKIPMNREERRRFYLENLEAIRRYTAVFAVSDFYAAELMQFLSENGVKVPEDISVAGFDDTPICTQLSPALTSVRQDCRLRAEKAINALKKLESGQNPPTEILLSVELTARGSTSKCTK